MAENKTVETAASVPEFVDGIENATRREDARKLVDLMRRATGTEPKMWGPSIIGFGKYSYHYDSGRKGEMLRVGFSPRKTNLTLYVNARDERLDEVRARLGKHKVAGSCLHIGKLADVDMRVLEDMVTRSWDIARDRYGDPDDTK